MYLHSAATAPRAPAPRAELITGDRRTTISAARSRRLRRLEELCVRAFGRAYNGRITEDQVAVLPEAAAKSIREAVTEYEAAETIQISPLAWRDR